MKVDTMNALNQDQENECTDGSGRLAAQFRSGTERLNHGAVVRYARGKDRWHQQDPEPAFELLIEALDQAALEATPGPWNAVGTHVIAARTRVRRGFDMKVEGSNRADNKKNAAFIAAANPDMVRRLIAAYRQATTQGMAASAYRTAGDSNPRPGIAVRQGTSESSPRRRQPAAEMDRSDSGTAGIASVTSGACPTEYDTDTIAKREQPPLSRNDLLGPATENARSSIDHLRFESIVTGLFAQCRDTINAGTYDPGI